jgi:hypothetical protein
MTQPTTVTVTLTDAESELINALAHEHGLTTPADVLLTLLHDAVAIYDALWDKTFADSQDLLDQLADEAHAEYVAGQTEEFDPDNDADAL